MMKPVRPKKFLGQHFLKNQTVASKISGALTGHGDYSHLLEIGPGMGVLTQHILEHPFKKVLIEMDRDSITYLRQRFPDDSFELIQGDFLRDFSFDESQRWGVIGNFPYNISSQILFRVYDHRSVIHELFGTDGKDVFYIKESLEQDAKNTISF
jgi:16S rRNA (adenine1518-N6/adenine1519-N6)-dimethyltransferase